MHTEAGSNVHLTLDLVSDVRRLLDYHFMVNALEAGTIVAVMAGVVGWFVVARRQAFVAHTLTTTAFPGAAGAILIGIPAMWGYFTLCVIGSLVIARAAGPGRASHAEQSAVIGAVQAFGLACGFTFVNLYQGVLGDLESLLFGTFLGITDMQVLILLGACAATLGLLAAAARPLWFASVDPEGALAAGLPVRLIAGAFLVMLGLAVAAVSQITGALLIFTLLVTPAATAGLITDRPQRSLVLTVAIALAVTWLGLGISYYSVYPVGFFITSISFALYVLARVGRWWADRSRRPREARGALPAVR
jgi:zinc/manganese transport system permease protein